jgi:hypothetical protein
MQIKHLDKKRNKGEIRSAAHTLKSNSEIEQRLQRKPPVTMS